MPWQRSDDGDKPYGDPRRAANIRWESRSEKALRKTREGAGAVGRLLTWPFRAVAGLLTGRRRWR